MCQFSMYIAAAPAFLPLRETANSAVSIIFMNGIGPVLSVLVVLTGLPAARSLFKANTNTTSTFGNPHDVADTFGD